MRIVYLAYVSPREPTGVPEKILSWARALRENASLTVMWVTPSQPSGSGVIGYDERIVSSKSRMGRFLALVTSSTTLVTAIHRELQLLSPDVIYLRHPLYRPGLVHTLRAVAPYVMEINGDPYPELVLQGRRVVVALDRLLGVGLFRGAAGFVGVTHESVRYASERASKPSVVIGNGVDCEAVPYLRHQADYSRLHFAYVGSPSTYDGLDRLLEGLAADPKVSSRIVLHLIGPGWQEDRRLTSVSRIVQVRTYSFAAPDELPSILSVADVGIGPLGVHRKGLLEASSLKVRRYLAHGLPVVVSCHDPDLSDSLPFVLRVSADNTPIDIGSLVEFAQRARDIQLRQQARRYAEENLSYTVKSRRLVAFLRSVVEAE